MLRIIKIELLMLAVTLIMLTILPVNAEELNPLTVVKNNKAAIVKFISKDKKPRVLGYGFVINPQGLVLTNSHVIGSEIFVVEDSKYKIYDVDMLVFRDSKRDLVLIKLTDAENMPVVNLGDSKSLDIGDKIITITDIKKDNYVVNNSIVEKMINYPVRDQNRLMLENTATISKTVEGSPLFDQKGQVIGILTSASDDSDPIGLFGIAINDLHNYKNHIKATLKDSSSIISVSKASYKKQELSPSRSEEQRPVTITKKAPGKYVMNINKNNPPTVKDQQQNSVQINQEDSVREHSITSGSQNSQQKIVDRTQDKQITIVKEKPKKRWSIFSLKKRNDKKEDTEKAVQKPQDKVRVQSINKPELPVSSAQQEDEDNKIASAIVEPELRSGEVFKTTNNFQLDLTGYWFDVDSGLNLLIEKKGNILTLKSLASEIPSSSSESIVGTFKKDGNVYAGVMDNTILCKKSSTSKSLASGNSCIFKEPAEIYFWDTSRISLKINTVSNYDCRVCSDKLLRSWKNRTWLKKAIKE